MTTTDEIEALRAEIAALRFELERTEGVRADAELALGILWMVEDRSKKVRDAHNILRDSLGKEGLKRGIQRAIEAGYEAEHPLSADWWAGKKVNDSC